ncbi:MAG: butyrate kinase [Bacillota bacterium]
MEKILVINPGSTSSKISVYHDETSLFVEKIEHSPEVIAQYNKIPDQYEMRKDLILNVLKQKGVDINELTAVVARGGLLPAVQAGAYRVNQDMVDQLRYNPVHEHASNLGAIIAFGIAELLGIPAYIYDPVTVDELKPIARVTGFPEIERIGIGHNLNMRAIAIKYAKSVDKPYNKLNLIVAHLGSGLTISLHNNGRMVDIVADDEGAFAPERSGGAPIAILGKYIINQGFDIKTYMHKIKRECGFKAHFGTMDAREIEDRIAKGDERAALVYEAFSYNVAKNIASLAAVIKGQVDAILLTGGIAYSKMTTDWITERVKFIAPVIIFPGENEMESLAQGTLRVLRGEEEAHTFVRKEV